MKKNLEKNLGLQILEDSAIWQCLSYKFHNVSQMYPNYCLSLL